MTTSGDYAPQGLNLDAIETWAKADPNMPATNLLILSLVIEIRRLRALVSEDIDGPADGR